LFDNKANNMDIRIDHIAILTDSLERLSAQFPAHFVAQAIEEQPGEGAREQYVFLPTAGAPSLLLLQAIQAGPYPRAMDKRGPGLHHFGCTINCLKTFHWIHDVERNWSRMQSAPTAE
jgi:hypothetical protein